MNEDRDSLWPAVAVAIVFIVSLCFTAWLYHH